MKCFTCDKTMPNDLFLLIWHKWVSHAETTFDLDEIDN